MTTFIVGSLLLVSMFTISGCQNSQNSLTVPSSTEGASDEMIQTARTSTSIIQEALVAAIEDEYKARATYQRVLDTFGDVLPFSRIVLSESQHVEALTVLFTRYGITVPEDTWYDQVPTFASVQDACAAGVQAEIDNVALYDELFAQVTESDIIQVFTQLSWASQNKHLPAFERCAQGTYTPAFGSGNGQQNGNGAGAGQ